jgi:hypothetical protein
MSNAVPLFKSSKAERRKVKLMIGLAGAAGSGKTTSALRLASGLVGGDMTKIAVADTENGSALYVAGTEYAPEGWEHVPFDPDIPGGYSPENYVKLIEYVEKDPSKEVLIIDSISHEWEGVGGCLEMVDALSKNQKGNTFAPWKTVTPLHRKFIDKMRNTRLHVIATMRSAQEYVLEKDERTGRTMPKKVGMKAKTREGTDYEFGVVFEVDAAHQALATKDRTGLFKSEIPVVIDERAGKILLDWTNGGKSELYTGENDQKKIFAATCQAAGIKDPKVMAEISGGYIGRPLDDLPKYLLEYLAVEQAKRMINREEAPA